MHALMVRESPDAALPHALNLGALCPEPTEEIERLVSALPEIYQPIYGHSEFSSQANRACEDRLAAIISIYRTLEAKLNRPLRVLDLGCAQGFFSLSLADLGATVYGVDLENHNVSLCKALAAENPDFKVQFDHGLIEKTIICIADDQYDLVLGLSVFHHLVRHHGISLVQKMLAILAEKTLAGIYEMALAAEPASWAALQPQNSRDLLEEYAFAHEFARHTHHLSMFWRPMFVASNCYWFLNGQAEAFHTWKSGSHAAASRANHKTRRYFFGQGHIVKLLTLDDDRMRVMNKQEYSSEIAFLMNPPDGFTAPQLFLYGQHQNEAWLVRECLPGKLLSDKMAAKESYDAGRIIRDTLDQLVTLEDAGLYHNDLRPANILVTPEDGTRIIDFGAITREKKSQSWPYDLFLSFAIYIHDVIYGRVADSNTERAAAFNPQIFPAPYRHALWKLYANPPEVWSFRILREYLAMPEKDDGIVPVAAQGSLITIMQAMGDACLIYQNAAMYLMAQNNRTATVPGDNQQ